MNLPNMLSILWVLLQDQSKVVYSETELTESIRMAVSDLDRFLPLDTMYEGIFEATVTGEEFQTAAAAGTYVSLANGQIQYQSEVVTNTAGTTTFVRNTDYKMNYTDGKITHVLGGGMANGSYYKIGYLRNPVAIPLSSLDYTKIYQVEHPIGQVPQTFVNFQIMGNYLFLTSRPGTDSQSQDVMADKDHYVIYYSKKHDPPRSEYSGSFLRSLDTVVLTGAMGYSMLMKALYHNNQAVAQLTEAAGNLTDAEDYLSAVSDSAAAAIKSIATALRTAISDALDASNAYNDKIGAATTGDLDVAKATWTEELKHILSSGGITDLSMQQFATAANNAMTTGNTYITGDTAPSLKYYLLQGDDQLTAGASYLTSDTAPSAKKYLGDGDDLFTFIKDYLDKHAVGTEMSAYNYIVSGVTAISDGNDYLTGTTKPSMKEYLEAVDDVFAVAGDNITKYLTDDQASIKKYIGSAVTPIGLLRNDSSFNYITGDTEPSIKSYLTSGDAKITTVNVAGQTVATTYREFAAGLISLVQSLISEADENIKFADYMDRIYQGYMGEVQTLLTQSSQSGVLAGALQANAQRYSDFSQAAIALAKGLIDSGTLQANYAQVCTTVAELLNAVAAAYVQYAAQCGEAANTLGQQVDRYTALANVSFNSAQLWRDYRQDLLVGAARRIDAANSYIGEAQTRIAYLRTYYEESGSWIAIVDRLLGIVQQNLITAQRENDITDRMITLGNGKRDEFWKILQDRNEIRTSSSISSRRQVAVR